MKPVKYLLLSLLGMSLHVSAQTVVDDAWVRATVAGQPSTGAFMHITSSADSKLIEVANSGGVSPMDGNAAFRKAAPPQQARAALSARPFFRHFLCRSAGACRD